MGGGGGGAGQPSGPGHLPTFLNARSSPSVVSDEGGLLGQDVGHTPAREVTTSRAAEALFRDSQFQQDWAKEVRPGIQRSHAGTSQQGFLDERALAGWFGLEDGHVPR